MILFIDMRYIGFYFWMSFNSSALYKKVFLIGWYRCDPSMRHDYYAMNMMGGEPYYFNRSE